MLQLQTAPIMNPSMARAMPGPAPNTQLQRWLAATLDEVDYGVLMVDAQQQLQHTNHAGRSQIGEGRALCVEEGRLRTWRAADSHSLAKALQDAAARGRRCLLRLNDGTGTIVAAVVPLPDNCALIVLPKARACGVLALQWFAGQHGLTPAEQQVLQALCDGAMPAEVAKRHEVAVSTVRTQIGSIRQKTGTSSIGALLRQVAALPPSVCALREVTV